MAPSRPNLPPKQPVDASCCSVMFTFSQSDFVSSAKLFLPQRRPWRRGQLDGPAATQRHPEDKSSIILCLQPRPRPLDGGVTAQHERQAQPRAVSR